MDVRYNIIELSLLSGCSRRNIYYYVQRGLLPRPNGSGNASYYGEIHLAVLQRIKQLQDQGVVAVAELQERLRPLITGHIRENPAIIAESSSQKIKGLIDSTLLHRSILPGGVELSWPASSSQAEGLVTEIIKFVTQREGNQDD